MSGVSLSSCFLCLSVLSLLVDGRACLSLPVAVRVCLSVLCLCEGMELSCVYAVSVGLGVCLSVFLSSVLLCVCVCEGEEQFVVSVSAISAGGCEGVFVCLSCV